MASNASAEKETKVQVADETPRLDEIQPKSLKPPTTTTKIELKEGKVETADIADQPQRSVMAALLDSIATDARFSTWRVLDCLPTADGRISVPRELGTASESIGRTFYAAFKSDYPAIYAQLKRQNMVGIVYLFNRAAPQFFIGISTHTLTWKDGTQMPFYYRILLSNAFPKSCVFPRVDLDRNNWRPFFENMLGMLQQHITDRHIADAHAALVQKLSLTYSKEDAEALAAAYAAVDDRDDEAMAKFRLRVDQTKQLPKPPISAEAAKKAEMRALVQQILGRAGSGAPAQAPDAASSPLSRQSQ